MHDTHEFLRTLALVLAVAAATSLVCQRLRQPVVFGYLLAGAIVGPHIPIPLIADEAMVETMAELGVVLLMFALGLEFSLRKLFAVGATASVVAILQSSALAALGFLAGQAFGWTTLESLYAGAVIAISSTTIIVKAFGEQGITGRFVQVSSGVLIIEDLIGIFLIAILTAVSLGGEVTVVELARTAGKLVAFLVGFLVVGILMVPRLIRLVARLNLPEITTVTAVAVCFGGAYLAVAFGYSVALGAFIAGALVAESGEDKLIERLIRPVRDMFAAIFFVAVGMLLDPRLIAENWIPVVVFTVIVIAGKVLAVSAGAFLAGYGTRTSIQTGMSLAQIGEFSFIIAGVGLATNATRDFLYPVAVAVSAITTLTTPWLIRAAGPVASYVDRRLPRPLQTFVAFYGSWMERLRQSPGRARSPERRLAGLLAVDALLLTAILVGTVAGFDRMGEALTRGLGLATGLARGVVVVLATAAAVPLTLGLIRLSRALAQAIAFRALPPPPEGRKVDLAAAPRRALIVAWQLAIVVLAGIPIVAVSQALMKVPIPVTGGLLAAVLLVLGVAFWRSATNLQGHTRAGAEVIVSALARQMAPSTGQAAPDTAELPAATGASAEARSLANVYEIIPGLGEPVPVRLEEGDYAVGRSLAALDLRDTTEATVLVIVGRDEPVVLPVGGEVLRAGDILALAGTPDAVEAARAALKAGPG
jgi:CPA2 family monovalent cation:H+ antiporter-2